MLRDQKNIYLRILAWLMLCAWFSGMHKIFAGVYFDIMHINRYFSVQGLGLDFNIFIKDIFLFWDAPAGVFMDVEYYFFLLGFRLKEVAHVYLVYSCFKVIIMLAEMAIPAGIVTKVWLDNYRKVKLVVKAYCVWMWFNLIAFVGWNNQYFAYWPYVVFFAGVMALYYIKGWYSFHNRISRIIWQQVKRINPLR